MKKLFLITLTFFASSKSFSQLELIKEVTPPYNDNKEIAYLSNSKTILWDIKDNNLNLYKENLDLYKTVKLPARRDSLKYSNSFFNMNIISVSKSYKLTSNQNKNFLISDKFFNNDDKIEFIITLNEFIDKDDQDRLMSTFLINEDGVILHTFPSVNINKSINMSFFAVNKSFAVDYSSNTADISSKKREYYKVNGIIPCECNCNTNTTPANLQKLTESKSLNLSTFPNPNTGKAIITYELPENTTKGTIHLYSQQGELLKTYSVNNQQTELEISTEEYSSGTYFYELETNGYSSGGKKMIVIN